MSVTGQHIPNLIHNVTPDGLILRGVLFIVLTDNVFFQMIRYFHKQLPKLYRPERCRFRFFTGRQTNGLNARKKGPVLSQYLKNVLFCERAGFPGKLTGKTDRAPFCMEKCRIFGLFCCLFYSLAGQAVKVRFPKEELAKESVFPVFNPLFMVLNRNVTLTKRPELGGGLSFGLDEPFYFPVYATGWMAFYISEAHGVSLTGTYFFPLENLPPSFPHSWKWDGLRLKEERGVDVFKVPYPQMMGFLNYQYTPFYGKISLTKKFAMNLSIYGFAGPGLIVFNEGALTPAGNIGIGQKLYFNKWLALRGDLRFYGYHGPAPAKIKLKGEGEEDSGGGQISYLNIPRNQKKIHINLTVGLGLVFLI